MSESLELVDESILISDGEDPAVDLNDDEIAELLEDPVVSTQKSDDVNIEAVEEPSNQSEDVQNGPEDIQIVPAESEDVQIELEDVIMESDDFPTEAEKEQKESSPTAVLQKALKEVQRIEIDERASEDDVVRIDSDEEVQNALHVEGDEENDGKDTGRSRKRNGMSSPRSPAPKRKRRIQTYFATQKAALRMISGLLGSYDATLHTPAIEMVRKLHTCNIRRMAEELKENEKRLRVENGLLNEKLTDEKRAHAGTIRKLLSMEDEMTRMRAQIHKLTSLLTIPPTPEVTQALFPPQAPPPHRMVLMPAQPSQPHYQQMNRRPPQPVVQSSPHVNNNKSREFARIPCPTHTNLGHTNAPGNVNLAQSLLDKTDAAANTIMLCVPLVHAGAIFPHEKPLRLPKNFGLLPTNPNLVVSINSSAQDFRENWQIGGRINYETLTNLNNKTIQVFVQVASFSTCGMAGRLPNADRIDWGCSMMWPCKTRSHRFRIRFHQQQQIPMKDRVTVFAVARDSVYNTTEMSQPTSLHLE